ncbi:flavin reductase family protein [Prauserella rugosa]|uniref:Flavin reductase (DIM6/NTAB) family NADH-FMN oxidoreductase RutF n=1 Tax=Prauserella rugosa TaxID=43354 RepID=A0A660C5T0_9PSEU|nr:flavin reductase family protein [Prauserella rugosa]TWH18696.1 flavin reductase (DIM6/NTAB) family NADH-FMN oxidoreductase RutF [Prauserella rugosa]
MTAPSTAAAAYEDPAELAQVLRGCLGRFATGVAVVTFDGVSKRHGLTVNSFTSVSLDPPLVLVAIQRSVRAHALLSGRPFTVNVLGADQRDVAMHFAGKPNLEPDWVEGAYAPRLAGPASWFECTPWAEHDGGDHTLFLGRVEHFGHRRGDCLAFVDGGFVTIPEA